MKFRSFLREYRYLVWVLIASFCARAILLINGGETLFNSGSDAPSYAEASLDISTKGIFSDDIRSIPYYPIGYSAILAFFRLFSQNNWWIFVVITQHVFYLLACSYVFLVTKNIYGCVVARIYILILAFSPTLIYAASESMYETLTASLLLIGCFMIIHHFLGQKKNSGNFNLWISSLAFSGATFLQPKMALIPILITILIFVRFRFQLPYFLFFLLSQLGAIIVVLRSWIAERIYSPSLNFARAIQVGGLDIECKSVNDLTLTGVQNAALNDRRYVQCAGEYFMQHPIEFIRHALKQIFATLGPMNGGNAPGSSTWFHGLDLTRILNEFGVPINSYVWNFQRIVAFVVILVFIYGFYLLNQSKDIFYSLVLISPIIVLLTVHAISDGDARYRIPFLPFIHFFLAVSMSKVFQKVEDRRV